MNKLEILEQFKHKYGDMINPYLISMKYCQTETDTLAEMLFSTNPSAPVIIDLKFIDDDDADEVIKDNHTYYPYFNSKNDIVDNARNLIELDSYSLINCIENLFTHEAEREIADAFESTEAYDRRWEEINF